MLILYSKNVIMYRSILGVKEINSRDENSQIPIKKSAKIQEENLQDVTVHQPQRRPLRHLKRPAFSKVYRLFLSEIIVKADFQPILLSSPSNRSNQPSNGQSQDHPRTLYYWQCMSILVF